MSSHDSSHDEDEFEFAEQFSNKQDSSAAAAAGRAGGSAGKAQAKPQRVSDQHFDEAMDVSDGSVDESVASPATSPGPKTTTSTKPTSAGKTQSQSQPQTKSFGSDDDEGTDEESPKAAAKPTSAASKPGATKSGPTSAAAGAGAIAAASKSAAGKPVAQDYAGGASESESESEEEEDTTAPRQTSQAKMYNPADYKHLQVSHEIQDLFDYIGRFQPQDIVLDTKMKPFIPDYIPAVGDIDAFIKIPSPDGKRDDLGLTVLDEPAAQQSDPTVLDLRLRVTSKQSNANVPMTVRSIEHADKNPKKITTWINNIDEVHRQKPPPNVVYTRTMPDIESLMQAWPTQFEQALKDIPLPSASLDLDVVQFSRIVCAVMDIPVYDKLTESLHVLFTLYSEFKNNSHFAQE